MNRTIVIGDIHGCFDELSELLEKVKLSDADRVVAVGDLTVKGPKSQQVLELFSSDSRFSSVVGNHDLALIKYWQGETTSLKSAQQRAFEELKESRDYLLAYLASLPTYIELETHVVVHAGLRQGIPLEQQTTEDLIELRTLGQDRTSRVGTPWYEVYDGPKIALFGHWPASEPRRGKYAIGVDTGCVYGYQLTAYIIETNQFESVQTRAAYDMAGRGKKGT